MNNKLKVSDHISLTEDIQRIMFVPAQQRTGTNESDFLVEAISTLEEKLGKEFTTEEIKVILETVVYLSEKIMKKGKKFVVTDSAGEKTLGVHDSRKDAVRQLQAIEASKARRGQ
jgi:hypothetical protein